MGCPSVADAMASCALREAMLKGRQQSSDCKAGDRDRRGFEDLDWTTGNRTGRGKRSKDGRRTGSSAHDTKSLVDSLV